MDKDYIDRLLYQDDLGDLDDDRFMLRLAIRRLADVVRRQQNEIKTITEDLKSLRNNTNAIVGR